MSFVFQLMLITFIIYYINALVHGTISQEAHLYHP